MNLDSLRNEKQSTRAFPKLNYRTSLLQLTAAIKDRLKETTDQVRKFEKVFKSVGRVSQSVRSGTTDGVHEEGGEMSGKAEGPELIDAIIIAAAEKVERYEITSYGTLCAWARTLGEDETSAIQHDALGPCST